MASTTPLYAMVEPDVSIYFDAVGHEIAFVAEGNGVAITNSIIAGQCSAFNVVCRPFIPSGSYEYVIVWRRGRTLPEKATELITTISETINLSREGSVL